MFVQIEKYDGVCVCVCVRERIKAYLFYQKFANVLERESVNVACQIQMGKLKYA